MRPIQSYQVENAAIRPLNQAAFLGLLSAAAATIQIIEEPLPRLLPWLKPGLSNVLVLYGIIRISPRFGGALVVVRSFLSCLVLGLLFSPPHLLALAGGLAATGAMSLALRLGGDCLGLAGVSILGAAANNIAQLASVGWLAGAGFPLWTNLAVVFLISIPSGLLVAGIAYELFRRTS